MIFTFMHRDSDVALLEIQDNKMKVLQMLNSKLVPIGAQMNSMKFQDWWHDRSIPRTRDGAVGALKGLNLDSTYSLLVQNLALSLTDCYWIKPINSNLVWGEVSLFSNDFIDVFGELTFDDTHLSSEIKKTKFSPATTQGEVKKKWCIKENGVRFLVKGNYGVSYQQSLNEVFATAVLAKQKFMEFVSYREFPIVLENRQAGIGCACDSYCSEELEFVSYWEIYESKKKSNNVSEFDTAMNRLMSLGLSREYLEEFFDYQISLDFIMTNTDRHYNNFGVLRDANTLVVKSMAPIYDNGNSMFFNDRVVPFGNKLFEIKTHSFNQKEIELLKNVRNRKCFDVSKLPSKNEFYEIYSKDDTATSTRVDDLWKAFQQKVNMFIDFQSGRDLWNYNSKTSSMVKSIRTGVDRLDVF